MQRYYLKNNAAILQDCYGLAHYGVRYETVYDPDRPACGRYMTVTMQRTQHTVQINSHAPDSAARRTGKTVCGTSQPSTPDTPDIKKNAALPFRQRSDQRLQR